MRYTQLLKYITPHKRTLFMISALLLAGAAASLANPLFAGKLTGTLLAGPDAGGISAGIILLGWLVLLVLRAIIGVANSFLVSTAGAQMAADLRSRVYEHMQALPLTWFQQHKQGDVLSLLSNDAESISRFVTNTVVQLLPELFTLVFALAVIAWLDPQIALISALLLPAYTVVTRLLGRRIRPLTSAWMTSWSGMVAFVNENLALMPVLKAFAREPHEAARFADHNRELLILSRRQAWLYALLTPSIGLLAGSGALLLLWLGIQRVESGHLTPAELVTLLLYVMLLTVPLSALAAVYGQVTRARGAAERLLEFFGEQPEPSGQGSQPLQITSGSIEFREVTFAYPGRGPLLDQFNLRIEAGQTVALTGPNGTGKSTLAHLLMRFIEPSAGQILVDGQDISTLELVSLRSQLGLVAQHTLLLNGTVADNIAYGAPQASLDDIKKAAIAAHADTFVESLPDRYDTVIGDQGAKLSGGQRQRISLARTLLKDPPILILDEATALFDPSGEKDFLETGRDLLRKRTVILITHRPDSLAQADRVIELDKLLRKPNQ